MLVIIQRIKKVVNKKLLSLFLYIKKFCITNKLTTKEKYLIIFKNNLEVA